MRFLRAGFPGSEIVGAEIQRRALRFCAATFGAEPLRVTTDPSETELPGGFDLVWCGSLLTHLDEAATRTLLSAFAGALASDGVTVVTTHGSSVATQDGGALADMPAEGANAARRGFEAEGFGYTPYEGQHSYGVSLMSPAWMRDAARKAGLEVASFTEMGWALHQDVHVLRGPTRAGP